MSYGFERPNQDAGGEPFRPFIHHACDVPYHWHNECEILLVLKGELRIVVEGAASDLHAGDVIIVNSRLSHHTSSRKADTVICGIHLDLGYYEWAGLTDFSKRHFFCKNYLHGKYFDAIIQPIRSLLARLLLSDMEKDNILAQSLVGLLCRHVYENVPWQDAMAISASTRAESKQRVQRLMELALGNPDLTLQEIADIEQVTTSHLSRLFRKSTGILFKDYLQNLKLDRISKRLRESEVAVADIGIDEGFSNGQHFYRIFKQRFGCTPSEYRRSRGHKARPEQVSSLEECGPMLMEYALMLPDLMPKILGRLNAGTVPRVSVPHDLAQLH